MFYHVYFISRENELTTVEYKQTTETQSSLVFNDIPFEKLIIPAIITTETEEAPDISTVLSHNTLTTANPIYRVPIPEISFDEYGNIHTNDNNIKIYNSLDVEIVDKIYRKDINYNENIFSIYAIAHRYIEEEIPEINKTISETFYSEKSEEFSRRIKESINNIPYTLKQISLKEWELKNSTEYIIEVQEQRKNILPNEIVILFEGSYTLKTYVGIVEFSGLVTLVNSITDLTDEILTVEVEQIDDTFVKISWNPISEATYKIYCNGVLHTSVRDTSYYLLDSPDNLLNYEITVVADNYFSKTNSKIIVYNFHKPNLPKYEIRGVNDVVFIFEPMPFKHAKLILYGIKHPSGEYIKLGSVDAKDNEFKLTKEMLDYSVFVYRYSLNSSYSEYSDKFNFEHPLIYNREISISYPRTITDTYWEYNLKWYLDPKAQGYAVYKNNLRVATISPDTCEYTGKGYIGDFLCVHSYYGLKEAESSVLYIGTTPNKLSIGNIQNLKVNKIVDKNISISWYNPYYPHTLVDVFVFNQNFSKILVFSNLTEQELTFKVPSYGSFYIKTKVKRKDDLTDITEFSNPTWFTTYKAGKSNVIEDCSTNSFIYEMEEINELIPCEYIVEMTHPETNEVITLYSDTNRVELPIEDTKPRSIKFYIKSSIITTGTSDELYYANDNQIVFTATAVQMSNLPYNYTNIVKIDIEDKNQTKKACKYNIRIEKSNGEVLEFDNLYDYFRKSLMFNDYFKTSFCERNVLEHISGLPIILDLGGLLDAKISITGVRFNHSYTVELDYEYQRPPQLEVLKAIGDYKGNDLGYTYIIEWKQEPNTMYRITNIDNGDEYNVKSNYISITSTERVNKFSICAYNITAITEPVELTFPEILAVTDVSTEDGNKIVSMNFTGVNNITGYKLFVDDILHQSVNNTNFLLKPFKGQKDIVIRGSYKSGIYDVLGLPTVYTYIPVTINDVYNIIYDIISEDRFLRVQLENDTIENSVKYINFIAKNRTNSTVYQRTLNIPPDNFKHVFEIINTTDLDSIYIELVTGWIIHITNIINLRKDLFFFNSNKHSFGSSF